MQRATKYGALALALAAVVAAGVVGTLLTRQNLQSSRGHPDAYTVAVGISGCGTGWSHATSGTQTFDVKNTSIGVDRRNTGLILLAPGEVEPDEVHPSTVSLVCPAGP